jgi:hypothetical protein
VVECEGPLDELADYLVTVLFRDVAEDVWWDDRASHAMHIRTRGVIHTTADPAACGHCWLISDYTACVAGGRHQSLS